MPDPDDPSREALVLGLVEPMPNVFTCGEAFSDYQGWVEGALRSADLVLRQGFGLDPISEVYKCEHGRTANKAVEAGYVGRSTGMIRKYIDPGFEPDPSAEALDSTRARPKVHEHFGVTLTYFDQSVGCSG